MRTTSAVFVLVVVALLLVPLGLSLWLDARWFGAPGLPAIFPPRPATEGAPGVVGGATRGRLRRLEPGLGRLAPAPGCLKRGSRLGGHGPHRRGGPAGRPDRRPRLRSVS